MNKLNHIFFAFSIFAGAFSFSSEVNRYRQEFSGEVRSIEKSCVEPARVRCAIKYLIGNNSKKVAEFVVGPYLRKNESQVKVGDRIEKISWGNTYLVNGEQFEFDIPFVAGKFAIVLLLVSAVLFFLEKNRVAQMDEKNKRTPIIICYKSAQKS